MESPRTAELDRFFVKWEDSNYRFKIPPCQDSPLFRNFSELLQTILNRYQKVSVPQLVESHEISKSLNLPWASHHIIYEQPCQGSEEEKREFTYDHKYAGNDTFQLLSKVLKTVVTISTSQALLGLNHWEHCFMTFDSFTIASRNTDILTFIFDD